VYDGEPECECKSPEAFLYVVIRDRDDYTAGVPGASRWGVGRLHQQYGGHLAKSSLTPACSSSGQ